MKTGLEKILRGSVQKKILLLVFLCVLPPLAVIINAGVERQQHALDMVKSDAAALVEETADIQSIATESTRRMLSVLSALPATSLDDGEESGAILRRALKAGSGYLNLLLCRADGSRMVAAEPVDREALLKAPFFRPIQAAQAFSASGFLRTQADGRPGIAFAAPFGSGDAAGIAVAIVDLGLFEPLSRMPGLPAGTVFDVADRNGTILFTSSPPGSGPVPGGALDRDSLALMTSVPDRAVIRARDADGLGQIVAYRRLRLKDGGEPYMHFWVRMPESAALSRAHGILLRDILLVLAATALALSVAILAGRLIIVGKVKRLIDAAGMLSAGNMDTRSGLDYADGELGQLAKSFDSMAHTLTQDIARRERAERDTAASREFLDKIINSISDPIFVKDHRHSFILVNDALCTLIGKSREEVLGRDDSDFFPKAQVDFFWKRDAVVLETGEEDISDEVITDKFGQIRVIVTTKTRYIDTSGNRFVVGIIRDVTENKRAGMELLRRTAELDERVKMLDCLYGISHLSQKRGVTLGGILGEAATLLPPVLTFGESAVARIVYEGVQHAPPGFRTPVASITEDILVRGQCHGFVEAGYPEPKTVLDDGPFTRDERKIIQVVAEHLGQIAERAVAEQELKESEERFRRIVETANEGIAVLNPAQRITYVNSVMADMLGYEPADIVGQHMEMFLYEPYRQDRNTNRGRRSRLDRKRERMFLRKDGTILCTIASVTPVTDREGHFAGSFGMYADITDRKMAEEKLHELNESLEQLVRDRTEDLSRKTTDLEAKARELEEANRELTRTAEKLERSRRRSEEATRAKSIFLANMSHEVRTPINAILGLSDLALRRGASGEAGRFLEMIHKSSHGLLALVNDILDFSKLEAGKAEVEAIDFNLPRLVQDMVVTFSHQAEAKGLRLDLVIDDDVPRFVVSDPTKLRAILANLCSNAVKFTEEGGVTVTVAYSKGVTAFTVEDTGIGIPEDKSSLVFRSFRQADESVGRKYGGTGLGLSISRKLTKLLGGTLSYQPRPGGGSRFSLSLPLKPGIDHEDARQLRQEKLWSAEHLKPMRILLAEDHEMGRELLSSFLGGFGHEVVLAEDGAQALEKLKQGGFDLVLMDGRMPVMDGMEAVRAIRAGACGEAGKSLPIVAITAQAMQGDREAFLAAGMDDYVTKPVDLDEVLLVLARHAPLSKRAEAREKTLVSTPEMGEGASGGSGERPAPEPGEAPLLDREVALARLKGMTALLEAMEATFIRATPEDLAELSRADAAGDAANVRLYAHRIKGNAAGVGALRLSEAARRVEAAAVKGGAPGVAALDGLKTLFDQTSAEMNRVKNTAGDAR
ncbi:PAS domain S-box protein [Fundidesulfovibrio terrae]|uniref:PAS domain S-box protein n=1 Tax=Fundidesulfovibrio terrae TaxID=2922866 RepID=UPI001FAFBF04|nr:PAS domain S-box protein [Fundidesulfovibrio terrae]